MKLSLPAFGRPRWTSDLEWTPDWTEEGVHERRLGRATVRFAGFSPKRIVRNLRKFDLELRERPRLLTLENVLFIPKLRCLYTAEGVRIDESMWTYAEPDVPQWVSLQSKMGAKEASYMPERVEPPASPERVRETGVFMGDAKQHYGHFITDGMSRMWALPDMARPVRGLVHMPPAYALSFPHVRAVWEVMGFPPSTLEEPSRPTLFERVICPVPAIQISRRIYREFDRPHRLAARAIMGGDDRGPKQGVYLSRGRLGAGHRQLEGESELEARLEKEGYRIVHPETLTFPEQMRLFNGDAPVVGATGSALHTVLFRIRRRGQTMAVLTPEDVGGRFPMIDMLKGSCTTYVNSLSEVTEAEDVSRVSTAERRFRIDPDRTMALLDGARFFRRRW